MSPVALLPLSLRNSAEFLRPCCLPFCCAGLRGFLRNGLPMFLRGSPSLMDVLDKGTTWTVSSLPQDNRRRISSGWVILWT